MDKELEDKETRNWVKTALALRHLKEGIHPFMKDMCEEHYVKAIQYLKTSFKREYTCHACKVEELQPLHAMTKNCKYPNFKSCACKKKDKKACPDPDQYCGKFYDMIKDEYAGYEPNWSNTNCELWSDKERGPWERMKCFIHISGYKGIADISSADITAYVNICLNNKQLNGAFGTNHDYLEQVRDCRNNVFHSGTMKISSADFLKYVGSIENTLKLDIFEKYTSTKEALKRLQHLAHPDSPVTVHDELSVREETLKYVKELKRLNEHQTVLKDLRVSIGDLEILEQKHTKQIELGFEEIKKHMLQLQDTHMRNKNCLDEHKDILNRINNNVSSIEKRVNQIDERTGEMSKKTLEQNENVLQYLDRIEKLLLDRSGNTQEKKINIPDMRLVVNINTSGGDDLVTELFIDAVRGYQSGIPQTELESQLKNAIQKILTEGMQLKSVRNECIAFYIKFTSLSSWIGFLHKYFNGEIKKTFMPVQEILRTYLGYEDLELTVELYEEEFEMCVLYIINQLEKQLSTVVHESKRTDMIDLTRNQASTVSVPLVALSEGTCSTDTDEDTFYLNKLLLTGLPWDCTEADIFKYMIDTLGCTLVQGLLTFHYSDASIALATVKETLDFQEVAEKYETSPLRNEVSISQVAITNCVYVTPLSARVDIHTITSYFQNEKGHAVEEVQMKNRNACVVCFRETTVVEKILNTNHSIGGQNVEVYRYFPCIARTEYGILASDVYKRTTICVVRPPWEDKDLIHVFQKTGIATTHLPLYDHLDDMNGAVWTRVLNCVHLELIVTDNISNVGVYMQKLLRTVSKNYRSIQLNVVGYSTTTLVSFVQSLNEWVNTTNVLQLDKIYLCASEGECMQTLVNEIQPNSTLQIEGMQPATSEGACGINTYPDRLLVTGMHRRIRETDLQTFLQSHTGYTLRTGSMVFHARTTDTAMITFDSDIVYQRVVENCSSHLLNGCKLRFCKVEVSSCAIISRLMECVDENTISDYFNHRRPVVREIVMQQRQRCCLVYFLGENDANEALRNRHTIDGERVDIHRFYTCIERTEPEVIRCSRRSYVTVCAANGNWSEMDFDEICPLETDGLGNFTIINHGGQFCHAKYFWNAFHSVADVYKLADDFGYSSLAIILNDIGVNERSELQRIMETIDWANTNALDKLYICSWRNNAVEELEFIESDFSFSSMNIAEVVNFAEIGDERNEKYKKTPTLSLLKGLKPVKAIVMMKEINFYEHDYGKVSKFYTSYPGTDEKDKWLQTYLNEQETNKTSLLLLAMMDLKPEEEIAMMKETVYMPLQPCILNFLYFNDAAYLSTDEKDKSLQTKLSTFDEFIATQSYYNSVLACASPSYSVFGYFMDLKDNITNINSIRTTYTGTNQIVDAVLDQGDDIHSHEKQTHVSTSRILAMIKNKMSRGDIDPVKIYTRRKACPGTDKLLQKNMSTLRALIDTIYMK